MPNLAFFISPTPSFSPSSLLLRISPKVTLLSQSSYPVLTFQWKWEVKLLSSRKLGKIDIILKNTKYSKFLMWIVKMKDWKYWIDCHVISYWSNLSLMKCIFFITPEDRSVIKIQNNQKELLLNVRYILVNLTNLL